MANPLNLLGIAKKSGTLSIGERDSGATVRAGKAKALFLAMDASENARRRAEGFVAGGKTPLIILPYTKEQLSRATGESGCSMLVFKDIGLAAAFTAALSESDSAYGEAAELIKQKNEKALARKREAASHERNKKTGKTAKTAKSGKRRKNIWV